MSAELARVEFTNEQVDLLKRTICQGASNDELALFLSQCKRTGLDPFARQIHAVKRFDKKQNREVMSIQIGIDGFRLIGERTGQADGQEGPYWCGSDGVWKDVWLSDNYPAAAKVLIFRKGITRPYVGIAHWAEYAQTYKDGNPLPMWAQMPAGQLAKCAESLAIRKAFPQELSGLYSPEEMGQAADEPIPTTASPATGSKQLAAPQYTVEGFAKDIEEAGDLDTLKEVVDLLNKVIKDKLPKGAAATLMPLITARKAALSTPVAQEGDDSSDGVGAVGTTGAGSASGAETPAASATATTSTASSTDVPPSIEVGMPTNGAEFVAWLQAKDDELAAQKLRQKDGVKAWALQLAGRYKQTADLSRWNKSLIEQGFWYIAVREWLLRTGKEWRLCVQWLNAHTDANYPPSADPESMMANQLRELALELKNGAKHITGGKAVA